MSREGVGRTAAAAAAAQAAGNRGPMQQSKQPAATRAPLRPVRLGPPQVLVERRADDCIVLRSPQPLQPYGTAQTERLAYWAQTAPQRIFLARRTPSGPWR